MKLSKVLFVNFILSFIMTLCMMIFAVQGGFFDNGFTQGMLSIQMEIVVFSVTLEVIMFIMFNIASMPFYIIKTILFAKDTINEQYIDTKESIYTRELPQYNAAVAGEIFDLKSSFGEEYVSGVIELISKGYIIENESKLIVDKSKSTEGLLRNEKYILRTLPYFEYEIDMLKIYCDFYRELKEDMYGLGLYNRPYILKELINKVEYFVNKNKRLNRLLAAYLAYFIFIISMVVIVKNLWLIILIIILSIIVLKKRKLTKKGQLEKEKMAKLKLFLEKETNFKNKSEAERELWGRYSAFAVAFGLNLEMKEEIYIKLNLKKGNAHD